MSKIYDEYMDFKKMRNCCNCKFFDGICCMYNCSLKAIFSESDSAKDCEHFEIGEYNIDELEKSNYK